MRRSQPDQEHPTGGEPAAQVGPTGSRWWNTLTKTILGLGAGAGAITAILSLIIFFWPKPDPSNRGEFTSVRLAANVPFAEYQQRVTVLPARYLGATDEPPEPYPEPPEPYPVPDSADPTASAELTEPPETDAPTTTPTAGESASLTSSPEPSTTEQSTTGTDQGAFTRSQVPLAEICRSAGLANLPNCETSSALEQMANGLVAARPNHTPSNGLSAAPSLASAPPPPPDVADSLEQVFEHTRMTTTESGETQPLGVVVTADITLEGLRGQPVQLSWSIWQLDGTSRLYGDWFTEIVAYQFEPTAEQETRSTDVWVPLPETTGSYFVRLKISVQGQPLGSIDSDAFH